MNLNSSQFGGLKPLYPNGENPSVFSKVKSGLGKAVDRAARVGREVRDIPTAIGTVLDPRTNSRGLATKDIVNQLSDPIQAIGGQGQSSAWKNNVRPWTDSKTGKVTGSGFGMAKQDVTSYTKPYNQRNDAYESANIKADAAAVEKYKATKAPGWERG